MGLVQSLKLILDKGASAQLVADMRAAGAQSTAALQMELKKKMGDLRHDLAAGLISKEEFAKKGAEAAQAYNAAVIERIKTLQAQGKLTNEEYVRLTKSLQIAGKTGGEQAGMLSKAWGGFKNIIASIGPAIGAAFVVHKIIDFVKESVKGAAESEAAWSELGVTLENNGVKLDKAKREVGDLATAIQRSTRFDDESVVRGFNTLLSLTGDYNTSLKALGPVADFAAAKHLTFEDASEKVGRALEGNLKGLKQYIPTIKDTSDVIGELGRFHGAAAAELGTFSGGLAHMKNMWGELHEALGTALLDALEGKGVFASLSGVIADLTDWIVANREQIAHWAKVTIDFFSFGLRQAAMMFAHTMQEIEFIWRAGVAVVRWVGGAWNDLKITFMGMVQGILTAGIALSNGLASVFEKIGMKKTAANLRQDAADMTNTWNKLATEIKKTTQDLALKSGGDDPTATKTTSLGGALATNVGAGADKTVKHFGRVGTAGEASAKAVTKAYAKAAKETADAWKASLDEITAIDKKYRDVIERGVRSQLSDLDKMIADHDRKQFQAVKDSIAKTTKAQDDGQAATRAAIVESGTVHTEVTDQMTTESTTAAKSSSDAWIDSLNLMVNSLQGLGKIAGGIFGGILDSISGIASGIGSVLGGLKTMAEGKKAGGLTGTIGQIAGVAGVAGGVIGVASTIIDVIGGLFHRDKDPGRLATNRAEFLNAVQNTDQASLDHLYVLAGRTSTKGWATLNAREDAYEAYLKALQLNVALRPTGTNTQNIAPYLMGGLVPKTGTIFAHAGEGVLTAPALRMIGGAPELSRINAAAWGGQDHLPAASGGSTGWGTRDDRPNLYLGPITLTGVADRDVPRRIVEEIALRLGQNYQKHSALSGNVALPE